MSIETLRTPQHTVHPLFLSRWSSRALTGEAIPEADLFSCFEAARWAPSGGNGQPWRFIYATRESAEWPTFLGLLNDRNRGWAHQAAALVVLVSQKVRHGPDGPRPARSHSFDSGAAWSNFAHQAQLLGWSARAMGGFDREAARTALGVPDGYEIEVVIAVGRPGEAASLPEDLRAAERPTARLPVEAIVAAGRFSFV